MSMDDKKHLVEEKTFAILTSESVNAIAESAGLEPVPHEAAAALGEDVSYRMRQLVMLATQYMKHAKRRRMTTEDLNKAATVMGLMPVAGHGSQEPTLFRHVKDADVHCVDDPEVNLFDVALGSYVPKQIGQPSIKAHWLAVEGVITSSSSTSQAKSKDLTGAYLKYYNAMTKALLGSSVETKKKALLDLRTNPNIVPVLPFLVNFVVSGIKNMSHDIGQLTTMLSTIRALLHNRSLYLMHKPYLTTIIEGVEFCALETLAASMSSVNDHWVLRDTAARLLADIVNRWNSPQNNLRLNTVKLLKEVLHDTAKPFYCHYGAIMSLISLGHKAVEGVIIPHLPEYWPHLQKSLDDRSAEKRVHRLDSQKVYGALRLAAEKTIRRHIRQFEEESALFKKKIELEKITEPSNILIKERQTSEEESSGVEKNIFKLYSSLYEYFGDSLSVSLPEVNTSETFKPVPKEDIVNLGDENSGKSGEELLHTLMEQIKLQEKLEEEQRIREQQERVEREKREREKRARQAIERRKREEEERRLRREEEEQQRRRREALEEERQRKWKEREDQMKELNKNRSKPQWQQQIELRRLQLEEEIQYSRMLEANKRQEGREKARREEEEEKARQRRQEEEMLRRKEEEDEQAGRSRVGLRRRKPVNYTEKDEDISDLFGGPSAAKRRKAASGSGHLHPPHSQHQGSGSSSGGGMSSNPGLPGFPLHSDISDDSDSDLNRRLAAGLMSPASAEAAGLAVSKVLDPSKGLLKLKIKRAGGAGSGTPDHLSHNSPSTQSPLRSPHLALTPPPPSPAPHHHRSKSSSGSEKESSSVKQQKKCWPGNNPGIQDISDPEEPFGSDVGVSGSASLSGGVGVSGLTAMSGVGVSGLASMSATSGLASMSGSSSFGVSGMSNLNVSGVGAEPPYMMYSPGAESSGSDSNPHRKALKLKLKLTPKDSASE